MHILVKTLAGKALNLTVEQSDSIEAIRSQLAALIGVPAEEQKLIHEGACLENGKLLLDYGVQENSSIYFLVNLEGGAKGKKKKKDTKKAKKKHKKRKVKLAILKYYKVEDDKIVRLKQMCKVCPPGTFIAEHPNRLYCGRCHTTYTKVAEAKKGGAAAAGGAKGGKGTKK